MLEYKEARVKSLSTVLHAVRPIVQIIVKTLLNGNTTTLRGRSCRSS